jgi:2-oxoglutarate ferredoxin oxidoreductase subunit gamma
MRYEIVFSGSGGQGMILSGIITAEAAACHDKKFAVQTQSYGPEARGGMTESYVIISDDEPVDYPEITSADVLVALSQPGLDRQLEHLSPNGIVIFDSKSVNTEQVKSARALGIPMQDISMEMTSRPISANIVALGALTAATNGRVSRKAMETAISERVPKGTVEKNLAAFGAGFDAMKKAMG